MPIAKTIKKQRREINAAFFMGLFLFDSGFMRPNDCQRLYCQ